jgi:Lar family restriction alleviation protein
MERPNFEDYLPKGTTIKEIQEMFKANESLYSYIQALDTYVDYFSNLLEKLVSQPSELLPCPFCGGKANGFHRRKNWEDAYMVSCLNCGIDTPKLKTQELAKELWNKRASQASDRVNITDTELTRSRKDIGDTY